MIVRDGQLTDAASIANIYNFFVETSIATFELEPVDPAEMERRIRSCLDAQYPYFVAEHENKLLGYAYAHQHRPRASYDRTVEVSVYTKPGSERKGVASTLYAQLIPMIFRAGFHTILAGIALPNEASVRLHEKFGSTKVAHFQQIGRKFDRWIDV